MEQEPSSEMGDRIQDSTEAPTLTGHVVDDKEGDELGGISGSTIGQKRSINEDKYLEDAKLPTVQRQEKDGDAEQCKEDTGAKTNGMALDGNAEKDDGTNLAEKNGIKEQSDTNKTNPMRKKKIALFMAYLGHGYNGMQSQKTPGVKTIENDLFSAIHAAGGISDANNDEKGFQKVHWMRSARTDKGVSAVGQVVSLNMVLHPPGIIQRINDHLPEQIRVFGSRRVVKGFDARKACDKRRYEYILPAWVFAPEDDPVKQKALKIASSRKKCNDSNTELQSISEENIKEAELDTSVDLEKIDDAKSEEMKNVVSGFEFDDTCQEKLNSILQQYEGTHNFHNYTVRTAHTASNAKRYIISFRCHSTFKIEDENWVRLVVIGQSFMMHQIRKMVGMAVATYLGIAPPHCLTHAMKTTAPLLTPMAPDLGLFLDECYFDGYNKRWAQLHERLSLEDFADEVAKFKEACIYPHIRRRDSLDFVNANWLATVNDLNYKFSTWNTENEHRRAAHGEPCVKRTKDVSTKDEAKRRRVNGQNDGVNNNNNANRNLGSTKNSKTDSELHLLPNFAIHEYSD